jgi:phage shock protein A
MTKIFVGLLIVCSLLMTAAMVVFVNRTEDYYRYAQSAEEQAKRFQREKAIAEADANTARQREAAAVNNANTQVADARATITKLSQDIAARDAEINDLKAKGAVAQATMTEQAAGLKTMGQNVADVTARIKTLTEEADKLRLANAELFGSNTDFSKRLDEAERERRFLNEQLNQLRVQLADANKRAPANGGGGGARPINAAAMPDLNGVIRSVKTDEGRTFATVSLGSQQKVEKGMEFFVIDQAEGSFLAKFIVDSVDPDSSFGRLEGPRVQNVKQNNLVLSKL